MATIKDLLQTADWKAEKHVPVIEVADKIKKGEIIKVTLTIGKEIPHPNTTEHHIAFVALYFLPKSEKFPYLISKTEFSAHGASVQGPNTSTIFAQSTVTCELKTDKSGTLMATSYCNIHGLWESSRELTVE